MCNGLGIACTHSMEGWDDEPFRYIDCGPISIGNKKERNIIFVFFILWLIIIILTTYFLVFTHELSGKKVE